MSMFTNVSPGEQNKLAQSLSLLALVGTAFLLALLVSEIRSYKFIGQGLNPTNDYYIWVVNDDISCH